MSAATLPSNYGEVVANFNKHVQDAEKLLPSMQSDVASITVVDDVSAERAERKRTEIKKARTSLENVRKQAKDPINAIGKAIDGAAKSINDGFSALEDTIATKVRHYEEEKAQAKAAEMRKKTKALYDAGMKPDNYGNFIVGNVAIMAGDIESMTLEEVEAKAVEARAEVERQEQERRRIEAERIERERKEREERERAEAQAKAERERAEAAEREAAELRRKLAAMEAAQAPKVEAPAPEPVADLLEDVFSDTGVVTRSLEEMEPEFAAAAAAFDVDAQIEAENYRAELFAQALSAVQAVPYLTPVEAQGIRMAVNEKMDKAPIEL